MRTVAGSEGRNVTPRRAVPLPDFLRYPPGVTVAAGGCGVGAGVACPYRTSLVIALLLFRMLRPLVTAVRFCSRRGCGFAAVLLWPRAIFFSICSGAYSVDGLPTPCIFTYTLMFFLCNRFCVLVDLFSIYIYMPPCLYSSRSRCMVTRYVAVHTYYISDADGVEGGGPSST